MVPYGNAAEGTYAELDGFSIADVVDHALDGLFVIDRNRRFVLFSRGCERITGYNEAAIVGSQCECHSITDCRDQEGRSLAGALCPSLALFDGEPRSSSQRMAVRHGAGHTVWVETNYSPIHAADGNVAFILGIMRDISEAVERETRLPETVSSIMNTAENQASTAVETMHHARFDGHGETAGPTAGRQSLDEILTTIEKREILSALKRAHGQRTLAANMLGISRSRLYRRMEALDIDPRLLAESEGSGS